MKIILNKDVQNLGEEGDVKEVAAGYARNFLLPKGFGIAYTKQNLALLEGKRKAIEKRKEEKKEHALGVKGRIENLNLEISMTVGENGRLFGSVTNAMLAEELAKLGIEVERKRIEIPEHTIKTTGSFVVKVKLYGNEMASLKVKVSGPQGKAKPEATTEPAAEAREAVAEEAGAPDAEGPETRAEVVEAQVETEAEPEVETETATEAPESAVEPNAEEGAAEEVAEEPATQAESDVAEETDRDEPAEVSDEESTDEK